MSWGPKALAFTSTQAPSGVDMPAQYDEQQQPGMCPWATTQNLRRNYTSLILAALYDSILEIRGFLLSLAVAINHHLSRVMLLFWFVRSLEWLTHKKKSFDFAQSHRNGNKEKIRSLEWLTHKKKFRFCKVSQKRNKDFGLLGFFFLRALSSSGG